jgi:hypothetical protein
MIGQTSHPDATRASALLARGERRCAARPLRGSMRTRIDRGLGTLLILVAVPACGRVVPHGGRGTVPARFQSDSPRNRWDVRASDGASCTAPCTLLVPVEDERYAVEVTSRGDPTATTKYGAEHFSQHGGPVSVSLQRDDSYTPMVALIAAGVPVGIAGGVLLGFAAGNSCDWFYYEAPVGCAIPGVILAGGVAMLIAGLALGKRTTIRVEVENEQFYPIGPPPFWPIPPPAPSWNGPPPMPPDRSSPAQSPPSRPL